MADKPIKPPGSITQPADNKNERIAEISNVNRAISNMQQKVNQQLAEAQVDIGEFEGIAEVQGSMVKVLNTLNDTVGTLGHGFAKIAADTGRASTEAFKQYGKAISEDINLNKRNIVITALSQSSPIFGYFAAKFVETDVFQAAKERMKSNISEALGGITSKFKEGFGGIIGRAREKGEKEKPVKTPKPKPGEIPKMQTGGYVKREGLAYLHPAEVVVPIDKILGKIDESIEITQELARISRRTQLHSLARMGTYVKSVDHMEKVGIFKGFLRAMREVQTQYQEPSDIRQLRALLAIQDSLGAQIGTYQQIWQKMLVEHPTFRQIAFAMKGLGTTFSLPYKFAYQIFKARGGWAAHLSKDRNPLKAMVENTGLIYADGMWQLENIARFTKATAQATRDLSGALTGKKYPPLEGVPRGEWSLFGLTRILTNWGTKWLTRGLFGKKFSDFMTKERDLYTTTFLNFLSRRRSALKEIYGEEAGYGVTRPETPIEMMMEDKDKALRVSEVHIENYVKEQTKHQKKMLGQTTALVKTSKEELSVTERMNKRQRRQSIFGMFGKFFGGRGLIGGGLTMLLSMASGFLIPWLRGLGTTLFPSILKSATAIATAPQLWAGAAAALIGTQIGKMLDKAIGISEGFQAHLDRLDKLAKDVGAENLAKTQERWATAQKGGAEGFAATEALKIQATLSGVAAQRREQVGFWGRNNILAIENAQKKFMNEHIGDYMMYGPEQLSALRLQWIKEGGYPSKNVGYPALQYGAEREAAFLKYAKEKGQPMAMEMMPGYSAYNRRYWGVYAKEKVGGVVREKTEMAREAIAEGLAKTHAMKEAIKEGAIKIAQESKELGKEVSSSITQATSQVTTFVTNNASTINHATQRVRDVFSEYEHAIIKGDYMMEGF